MIREKCTLLALTGFCLAAYAQTDTAKAIHLEEVIIKAFEQNRQLKSIPAAVSYVHQQALERFSAASVVSAINSVPGIRMEERSPGSYRFNIRGSSLRSPFGVRNVKIYYNDLPFTDPGGHSYLNQLGYYNFGTVEIIKGPGSSLYGAGTGGVLLIESLNEKALPGAFTEYTAGSYRQHNLYASVTTNTEKHTGRFGYQHQESDGYRDHSKLRRDVYSWDGLFRFGVHRTLKTTFLYGSLFYETPGALTLSEYQAHPRSARPATGAFPGAAQAKAAIYQQSFMAGASYTQPLLTHIRNKTVLYGAYTELRNPNIRAYDRSSEPHVGGRTTFTFEKEIAPSSVRIMAGGEGQQGFVVAGSFKNSNGNPDSLRYSDDIRNRNLMLFAQASWEVNNWLFSTGVSWSTLKIKFQRFNPGSLGEQSRRFTNNTAPRFSLLKKFRKVSVYGNIAKGFSPPTTTELLPTGGSINIDLNAEHGINYDAGFRGSFFNGWYIDVNAFIFSLRNTIVQRRDAAGGDYFINAGSTKQHGVETYLSYVISPSATPINRGQFWLSHTWHRFRYKSFQQLANNFSGKQLPAQAPHTLSAGIDVQYHNGLQAAFVYYFSDKIPLNDANTAYAEGYHLLSLKIGYEKPVNKRIGLKLFAGVDNLLNQQYSLGNDINGFGGRYYNAAPERNYYAGISLRWNKNTQPQNN